MPQTLERERPPHDLRDLRHDRPRWVLPAVAALSLLALGVRALVGLRSGLWRDEGLFLFVVGEPSWGAMIDFLRQHESHPPLFYVLMRLWLSLAGDSDAAALSVPIVLGAALVPALHVLGTRLLSWRVGLIAASAAAVSPVAIEHGAQVRPYSLLPLLALASTAFLARAVDTGGRAWLGHILTSLALVYTHNWGWLAVAGQWVAVAVHLWRRPHGSRRRLARQFVTAQVVVGAGFLPWLPALLHQVAHAGHGPNPMLAHPTDAGTALLVAHQLGTGTVVPRGAGPLVATATLWAVALAVVAAVVPPPARRHRARQGDAPAAPRPKTALTTYTVVPLVTMAAAVALSARSDALLPRCLAIVAPLLLLVLAYGLDRLRAAGWTVLAASAVAVLLVGYTLPLAALAGAPRSQARELAGELAGRAGPNDLLVISPWWFASSVNRYYQPDTSQINFPSLQRVGATPFDDPARRFADPTAFAQARLRITEAHAAGRRTWWVGGRGAATCDEPTCTQMVEQPRFPWSVAIARTSQLRAHLEELYGPPDCDTRSFAARYESLELCSFEVR